MRILFRRVLTTLLCFGTLIVGNQSWAADANQKNNLNTEVKVNPKIYENCQKPCDMKSIEKNQHDHSEAVDMSKMDRSKMMNMDHSKMNMSNK